MIITFDQVEDKKAKIRPLDKVSTLHERFSDATPPRKLVENVRFKLEHEVIDECKFSTDNHLIKSTKHNSFVMTYVTAYHNHYPVSLSPSHLWILILQGISRHIQATRQYKKDYQENITGCIEVDSTDNLYSDVLNQLQLQSQYLKLENHHSKLFSTSDEVQHLVTCNSHSPSMSEYYKFDSYTDCGFPYIKLEGTVDDWIDLQDRVVQMYNHLDDTNRFIKRWTYLMVDVLDDIIATFDDPDNINYEFWNNFLKSDGGSGGPFVNGWINIFLPYIITYRNWEANPIIKEWPKAEFPYHNGVMLRELDNGLNMVKIKTPDGYKRLVTGFIGVEQDIEALLLKPSVCYVWLDGLEGQMEEQDGPEDDDPWVKYPDDYNKDILNLSLELNS